MRTYVNSVFPATNLSNQVLIGDSTVSVSSEANLPASGQYVIAIENELMLVTGGWSTLTLTVTRGLESTAIAAHATALPVYHPVTAGTLDAIRSESGQIGTYANLPVTGHAGDSYQCVDFPCKFIFDGSVWCCIGFTGTEWVDPTSYSWTTFGTGGGNSVTQNGRSYHVRAAASGSANQVGQYTTLPSAPYTYEMGAFLYMTGGNWAHAGMIWRESSSGKMSNMCVGFSSGGQPIVSSFEKWNGLNSYAGSAYNPSENVTLPPGGYFMLRLTNDTTSRILYASTDYGITWRTVLTVGINDFLIPNQMGIIANPNNSNLSQGLTLVHWKRVS